MKFLRFPPKTGKVDADVLGGGYAKKQLLSPLRLIAWSHSSRYRTGARLARRFAGQRLLDYGCGDGTFLGLLMAGSQAPASAVGAEIDPSMVDDCRKRLGSRPGLRFVLASDLDAPEHAGAYSGIVCMEVLEHVVEPSRILEQLFRLLSPCGTLIVSVPVEIGLPLLGKQVIRTVAGWLHIGDYPGITPYSVREYWRSIVAGPSQHIRRPVHESSRGPFHDHKGFNWKVLRELLQQYFHIDRTLASPLTGLPAALASQVWFVARKRSVS